MKNFTIDQSQLLNLNYSLFKEFVMTNKLDACSRSSVVLCNTSMNHGLLTCPVETGNSSNRKKYILLSAMDEKIVFDNYEYNLSIRKYPCNLQLEGLNHIKEISIEPYPIIYYQMGIIEFSKEIILASDLNTLLIRYKLINGYEGTNLQLQPFLSYRPVNSLNKADSMIETEFTPVNNGIILRPYNHLPGLYFNCSKEIAYQHKPDWYYSIEYMTENTLRSKYSEDQLVPGRFDIHLEEDESVIFAIGIDTIESTDLHELFFRESLIKQKQKIRNKKRIYSNKESDKQKVREASTVRQIIQVKL